MIIVLFGPSGSGKTTIAERLCSGPMFRKLPTCTTRQPRNGEINGIHYHFLSEEDFKKKLLQGEIVEWTEYAGSLYGTSAKVLSEAIENGDNIVLVMDANGCKAIKRLFPQAAKTVYLDRPYKELIKAILERDVSNEEKANRIVQLQDDFSHKDEADYVVKNDVIEDAVNTILEIV